MKILHAGPVRLGYENGFLRRFSYNGTEVLRMVYFALRDHNWNTIHHQVENESMAIDDDHFEITYQCFNLDGGVAVMKWEASISGRDDGSIIFEIRGTTLEDFRRNRAGFCVLHPLNVTGTPCTIVHEDSSTSTPNFPVDVSPDNPFKNIRAMNWESAGERFSLEFEGDLFETEDQRNWGDASFKTFCTPLDQPFPLQLRKGEQIFQRVTFKPLAKLRPLQRGSDVVTLQATGSKGVVPALGIGASTEVDKLPEDILPVLRALRLSHYRVDLYPSSDRFSYAFSQQYENAYALSLPLEVVLHLTDNFPEELEAFSVICQQNKVRLKKVLFLKEGSMVTGQEIIDHPSLRSIFPRVVFGAGTNYNFNEINKNRFRATGIDFISYSMDPQEHASDNLTILENAESLEHLIRSTKSIYGADMPVHISPLTMRKRYNPYATNPDDLFLDESVKADPRQKLPLCSLWTFAAMCSLSKGGASAVTLYQTVGDQGIINTNGTTFPVYDTIQLFSSFQRRSAEWLRSSDPHAVAAVLLDGNTLAMANLSEEPKAVSYDGVTFQLDPGQIKTEKKR